MTACFLIREITYYIVKVTIFKGQASNAYQNWNGTFPLAQQGWKDECTKIIVAVLFGATNSNSVAEDS